MNLRYIITFVLTVLLLNAADTEVKLDANTDASGFKITDNSSTTLFRVAGTGVIELPVSASAPGTPSAGDVYQNGTNIYYYNGTSWDDLTEGSGGPVHVYGEMTGIGDLSYQVGTTTSGWRDAAAGDLSGITFTDDNTNGDYLT